MSSIKLKRVGLENDVLQKCSRAKLSTCQDILSKNEVELMKLLDLGLFEVRSVLHTVSRKACPQFLTALEMKKDQSWQFCETGLKDLDLVLKGGLLIATLTEIAGPSGCGKTQFCLMVASKVAHMSVSNKKIPTQSVVYIDTENAFSAERLVEIATSNNPDMCDEDITELASNVHIFFEETCASLLNRLENMEEFLIEKNVKLMVVDSIASLVRKEFDNQLNKNLIERTNLLAKEANIFKYLAESFSIPVIVTNQITTRYGKREETEQQEIDADTSEDMETPGEGGYVTAALGNTWSHCVNTRLIVQYLNAPYRQILIAKSPVAPFAAFVYRIQKKGLVLEDEGSQSYKGTDPGLQHIRVRSSLENMG